MKHKEQSIMAIEQKEHVNELLTEEELAALEESDFIEGDEETEVPFEDDDDDIDERQRAAAAEDEDEDEGDEDAQAEPVQQAAEAEDEPEPAKPAPLAADRQRLTTLQSEFEETQAAIDELTQQYQDGDFTDKEFRDELSKLNGKLVDVQSDAKMIQRRIEDDNAAWDREVTGYFKANPGLRADDEVLQAYDRAVRYVSSNYPNLSMAEQLTRAHRQLAFEAEGTPLAAKIPALKGAKPAPKPPARAKPADDGMRTPPTTLARASATEVSGEADSALLQMAKLVEGGDSDKIEAAFRKLSPEQRDAFSNMDL